MTSLVQGASYLPPPNVEWALSGTALYVAHLAVFCLAAYCFLLTRRRQRFPITLAVVSIGTVVLSTCIWAAQIVAIAPRFHTAAPDGNPDPAYLRGLLRRAFVMYTLSYLTGNITTGTNLIALVLWSKWTIAAMLFLWLANVGIGIGSLLVCLGAGGPDSCESLQFSSLLLCLTFNAVATTLFVRIARSHNRGDLTRFFARPLVIKLLTIALVLVGCVYLALGISRLYQIAGYGSYSLDVVHGVLYQWVGLYPTAVSALLRIIILNSPGPRIQDDPKRGAGAARPTGVPDAYPLLPLHGQGHTAAGPVSKEKLLAEGVPRGAETAASRASGGGSAGGGAEQSTGNPAVDAARPRRWRAVHQAARGAGISPEALLASISLVQHPEMLRERYEGTMPPRYEG